VFRDFTGQVPLDTLGQTLVADLNKLWVISLLILGCFAKTTWKGENEIIR
jgi:hypothetical protein